MKVLRLVAIAVLFLNSLLCLGCSPTGFVPVSGTATHQGQPLADLFIKLENEAGDISWGTTDANGHFTLISTDRRKGAAVGTHQVWVEHRPLEPMPGQDATLPLVLWKAAVEGKYGRGKSALAVEIRGTTSDLRLELD